jgi:glycosyltransferase involved in cell wall biosynthesis
LPPFIDTRPYRRAWARRHLHRHRIARRCRIPAGPPWLLAVGMMRHGDKLASYRLLGRALGGLKGRPWRLIVVGDGPARAEVGAALAAVRGRVHLLGALPAAELVRLYAASDLFVWPAINEAIGMAILEAQSAGLPAVAGEAGATGAIVADGETGRLTPVGRTASFRRAIAALLARPETRRRMSQAAIAKTGRGHDIGYAAARLDAVVRAAVARAKKRRRP